MINNGTINTIQSQSNHLITRSECTSTMYEFSEFAFFKNSECEDLVFKERTECETILYPITRFPYTCHASTLLKCTSLDLTPHTASMSQLMRRCEDLHRRKLAHVLHDINMDAYQFMTRYQLVRQIKWLTTLHLNPAAIQRVATIQKHEPDEFINALRTAIQEYEHSIFRTVNLSAKVHGRRIVLYEECWYANFMNMSCATLQAYLLSQWLRALNSAPLERVYDMHCDHTIQ